MPGVETLSTWVKQGQPFATNVRRPYLHGTGNTSLLRHGDLLSKSKTYVTDAKVVRMQLLAKDQKPTLRKRPCRQAVQHCFRVFSSSRMKHTSRASGYIVIPLIAVPMTVSLGVLLTVHLTTPPDAAIRRHLPDDTPYSMTEAKLILLGISNIVLLWCI